MKKIAIIGASELQNPLILKAKELGYEAHVFAWQDGSIGEKTADYFYPISIVEKEEILKKCKEIGIDCIATIASDLATVAVNLSLGNNGIFNRAKTAKEQYQNAQDYEQRQGGVLARQDAVDAAAALVFLAFLGLHHGLVAQPFNKGETHLGHGCGTVKAAFFFHLNNEVFECFFFVL